MDPNQDFEGPQSGDPGDAGHAGYAGHTPRSTQAPWSSQSQQSQWAPPATSPNPYARPADDPTEPFDRSQPAPDAGATQTPGGYGPAGAADPMQGYSRRLDEPTAVHGYGPAGAGWVPPTPPPTWHTYGPMAPPPAGPPAAPPGPPARGRRTALRAAAVVAVVVATTGAGVGLGHEVWRPTVSANSIPPSSSTTLAPSNSNNGSGNNGTGTGTGNTGTGTGNTGSGEFPGFFPGGSSSSNGGGSSSSATGAPSNIASIAASVDPALVDIVSTLGYQGGEAAGTGIVLTSNGEILTNNHVIDGATNIRVTDIGNGQTYSATVVGYSRTNDVAVIQLQGASGLRTATIGDSSNVSVGQGVVALGNAGGVGGTPSAAGGSVTGLDQTITASDEDGSNSETLAGLIEINANIQPGDSGGSLVNTSGQVIGIDTAASTRQQFTSQTTDGYAIPIDAALTLARQIEAGQASSTVHIGRTGFLGVSVESVQTGAAGAAVAGVVSGAPAATAGLAQGDTITAVDGQAVSSPNGLTTLLLEHHPGDSVTLTWTDASGHSHSASVTLENGPAQ